MKYLYLLCIGLVFLTGSYAQPDSARLRISLLTCAPGDEPHSFFGHTALRIIDSTSGSDLVYNWGTFDFTDPDFYPKFVKGRLDYFLSVAYFAEFIYEYEVTERGVTEQILALDQEAASAIVNAIRESLNSNNRFYKYDFLHDNCTSRVRDLLAKFANMQGNKKLVPPGTTFRNLLHEYLDRQHIGWIKLGIDILIGSPADKAVTTSEAMFLPDYLMKGVDRTTSFHAEKKMLIATDTIADKKRNSTPLYIIGVVSIVSILLSLSKHKTAQACTRIFDFLLLFITGALGCLLLFTWFGTDHASFKFNYNLLWALPTNLVASAFVWNTARLKKYFTAAAMVYGLLLIVWFWLPQQMNPAIIPIVIALFFRMLKLARGHS